jgi:hypothetical protein
MLCLMSHPRIAPLASVAVALAVLLAGCHGGGGATGSPSASGSSSTSASAAPTATPTPTATADTADCSAGQLQIVYSPSDNSAGHAHGLLTFGNLGQTDCILTGYATVYFQNPTTLQPMGQPASHDPSEPTGPADASVDGFSSADLTTTQAGFVDGCTIVTATALLVTPPGMSHQFVVPIDATPACSDPSIGLLTVSSNYIPIGS